LSGPRARVRNEDRWGLLGGQISGFDPPDFKVTLKGQWLRMTSARSM